MNEAAPAWDGIGRSNGMGRSHHLFGYGLEKETSEAGGNQIGLSPPRDTADKDTPSSRGFRALFFFFHGDLSPRVLVIVPDSTIKAVVHLGLGGT